MRRVRVIVSGRVQGVGFRYHAGRAADRIGVAGWVRNLPDGTVETEVEGDQQSVDEFLAWLAEGPSGAHVHDTRVSESEPTGASGFHIRH